MILNRLAYQSPRADCAISTCSEPGVVFLALKSFSVHRISGIYLPSYYSVLAISSTLLHTGSLLASERRLPLWVVQLLPFRTILLLMNLPLSVLSSRAAQN